MVRTILILMLIVLCLIVLCATQSCPNCATCSTTVGGFANCTACNPGFVLVQTQIMNPPGTPFNAAQTQVGSCQPCPSSCDGSCQVGMIMNPSLSPPFASLICNYCGLGSVYNPDNGQCVACVANCLECVCFGDLCQSTICTQCNSAAGYVYDNSYNCILQGSQITDYCSQVQQTESGLLTCTQCSSGSLVPVITLINGGLSSYSQVVEICELCPFNCASCTYLLNKWVTPNVYIMACMACMPGYTGNFQYQCVPCPNNCTTCDVQIGQNIPNPTMICITCNPGFVINGYSCIWDNVTEVANQYNNQINPIENVSPKCPNCNPSACQNTPAGLGNCTFCASGAYLQVQTATSSAGLSSTQTAFQGGQVIGLCRPCPSSCLTCSYQQINTVYAVGCTTCPQTSILNVTDKTCLACSANCNTCSISGPYVYCTACNSGYSLNYSVWPLNCAPATTATANLQTEEQSSQPTQSGSNTSTIIGLSVWGAVMTLVAGAFLFLWCKQSNEAKPIALLDGQTRTVSF